MARETVDQLFGGEATELPPTHNNIHMPVTNQMVDTLAGYLDNIAAAATNAGGGKELAELAASVAILVDTNAVQARELKQIREQINALKNNSKAEV